jgi:hypothetical protein
MGIKRKARLAARLAARDHGISQKTARELIMFWFDSEAISPNAPIEVLARAVIDYAHTSSTGAS